MVVLLDEKGKQFTSREFAQKLEILIKTILSKNLFFSWVELMVFRKKCIKRANEKNSISKMTFTHQMIRLFFVEQIYRNRPNPTKNRIIMTDELRFGILDLRFRNYES